MYILYDICKNGFTLSLSLPFRDIKTHVFYTHSQRLLTALSNASSKSNGLPFLN